MRSLRVGDVLAFSSGRRVRVGRRLGEGNTTAVFAILGDAERVLRIPRNDNRIGNVPTRLFNTYFNMGHQRLRELGVPTIKVHETGSSRSGAGEYAIVERLPKGTLLMDELVRNPGKIDRKQFRRFFRRTAVLRSLSDFHVEQIAQKPGGDVVLFDWAHPSGNVSAFSRNGQVSDKTVLDPGLQPVFPETWLRWDAKNRRYLPASPEHQEFATLINDTRSDIIRTRKAIHENSQLHGLFAREIFASAETPSPVIAARKRAEARAVSLGLF